ncbi:MAG: FAD-dependent oxidoreductase [Beijerinckiaceae bacterium]
MQVTFEKRGAVAVITINNPSVHALSTPVRAQLLAALDAMEQDEAVEVGIITTAGRTFIAGADMREMERPLEAPFLPDVIARLAQCTKPVVAAMFGSVLGGGLEIALACRARIATEGTMLGFPEVKIGLVPGASGTQRLLRLTDFATAARMVTSAKLVSANEAMRLGLIHAVASGDPVDAAMSIVATRMLFDQKRFPPLSEIEARPAALPEEGTLEALHAEVKKAAKGQAAAPAALAMMEATAPLDYTAGLAMERALFVKLRQSREAHALRRLFLAEREAGKTPKTTGATPAIIKTIGVVGAGLMGCGIAYAALTAGYRVVVVEDNEAALERGQSRMADLMASGLKSGRLTAERQNALQSQLVMSVYYSAFADCDLVIEAVFEDMAVKQKVFAKLDRVVRPNCILASNTSYLDLDAIAALTKDSARFLGLHFFSPAHVMRLCEVVEGAKTSPDTLATGVAVARKLGKIPIVTGVCEGFCGNRILKAYRIVAEAMVEDGASPTDVDRAMTQFGFPMGPFAVQDMAGLEIAYANRKLKPALRSDGRTLSLVECLVEAGRLGRKNGKGWYAYTEGLTQGQDDPVVSELIAKNARDKNLPQRTFSQDEIREALLAAMASEGTAILAEGIVSRAEDIDLVMVHGYGFPAHKGGPMFITSVDSKIPT